MFLSEGKFCEGIVYYKSVTMFEQERCNANENLNKSNSTRIKRIICVNFMTQFDYIFVLCKPNYFSARSSCEVH